MTGDTPASEPDAQNSAPPPVDASEEPAALPYARQPGEKPRRRWPGVSEVVLGAVCIALLFSILLPSRSSGPPSKRARCSANLRGIGQGVFLYYQDEGTFPPELSALVQTGYVVWRQLECPAKKGSTEGTIDYHYVTGMQPDDPGDWIIAFEDAANHGGKGGNVLFIDAHVEFIMKAELEEKIRRFKESFAQARGHPPVIVAPSSP